MNILFLGGTRFLGPSVVSEAERRGHRLTLFTRGQRKPPISLESLHGDRADLGRIVGARRWDAVIDTSAYHPEHVAACQGLNTDHYLFVSTRSVYADLSRPYNDEGAAVHVQGEDYGSMKAACELVPLPMARAIVRPGLIVGPHDHTGRFTTWPVRLARGGQVLAPGTPDDPVQFIDVRDLASFMIHLVEERSVGIFNTLNPPGSVTMGQLLLACEHPPDTQLVWIEPALLEELGLQAWSDLPVWLPPTGEHAGYHLCRTDRAQAAGLTIRPLRETCADTLAWWRSLPEDSPLRVLSGLSAQREIEALELKKATSPLQK